MNDLYDVTNIVSIATAVVAVVSAVIAVSQAKSARRAVAAAEGQLEAAHRQAIASERSNELMSLSLAPRFALVWNDGYVPQHEQWEQFVLTYLSGPDDLDQVLISVSDGSNLDGLLLRATHSIEQSLLWNNRSPKDSMSFESHLCSPVGQVRIKVVATKGELKWPCSAVTHVKKREAPMFSLEAIGLCDVDFPDRWETWDQFALTYEGGTDTLDSVDVRVRQGDNLDEIYLPDRQKSVDILGWDSQSCGDEMIFAAHLKDGADAYYVDVVASLGVLRWTQTLSGYA
ncbi:hypothetical protein AB0M43_07605 [Longispora sp. NPDC051575]|uniref:hypothetical protein n=1 Tax=Longispora sp. NPDC051575 TaxID=3154943 RepID=UPI003426AED1